MSQNILLDSAKAKAVARKATVIETCVEAEHGAINAEQGALAHGSCIASTELNAC